MNQPKSHNTSPVTATHVTYLLFVLGTFIFPVLIIALIVNYVRADSLAGSWLHTHTNYQMQTFWKAFIWFLIGVLLMLIVIGFIIIIAVHIWFLYRMIKGWIYLSDGLPMNTL